MDEVRLQLIGGAGDESGILRSQERGAECWLEFVFRDTSLEATANDFFAAFCAIRRELEVVGLIPFCYGASLNVYPSAMSRDMSAGLKAYRMTLGQRAKMADLVDIFAVGSEIIPAKVVEQEEYWQHWLASLQET